MEKQTWLLVLIIAAVIGFIFFLISDGLFAAIIYGIYASTIITLWAVSVGII